MKDNDFDMKGMMREVTSLQRGMMFAMLRAFWPYILGGLILSGASIAFIVWVIVQIVT